MAVVTFILDACALIAFLRAEEGGEKVKKLFKEPQNQILMHAINLGEVYYDSIRFGGKDVADEILADVRKLPLKILWNLDYDLIKRVGHFKTDYRISYADAFVLAVADRSNSTVISTDHHEFDPIDQKGILNFLWLR